MPKQSTPKPEGWTGSGKSDNLFLNNLTGREGISETMNEGEFDPTHNRRNVSSITDYEGEGMDA